MATTKPIKVYRLRFAPEPSGRHGMTIECEWVKSFVDEVEVRKVEPVDLHEADLLGEDLPSAHMEHRHGHWQLIVLDCSRNTPRVVAIESPRDRAWAWLTSEI